jgi:hypothetical protein
MAAFDADEYMRLREEHFAHDVTWLAPGTTIAG